MLLMISKTIEEPAIAREAGEINDDDLNAFQILLKMRAYGEALLAK